jgi:hypothetical protein
VVGIEDEEERAATGPAAPRAASVSAKNTADPPWRVPVSTTCSTRRSKMISW